MRTFDDKKIERILEKMNRSEVLSGSEIIYGKIIQLLRSRKKQKVKIRPEYKNELKNTLLTEYDRRYSKKSYMSRFFFGGNFLVIRYIFSFCLISLLGAILFNQYLGDKNFSQSPNNSLNFIEEETFQKQNSNISSSSKLSSGADNYSRTLNQPLNFGAAKLKGESSQDFNTGKESTFLGFAQYFGYLCVVIVLLFLGIYWFKRGRK